ncbi:hypothetical protein VNI00_008827 [Paramarasmius palmivorus]|uniref:Gustatory receptor n=1 Tax=Paramarasmius palmivorus TaxID=297713 RepID=A0AAW0CU72_9AGAR
MIPEDLAAEYLSVSKILTDPVTSLSATYFAYGLYVLLFALCISQMSLSRDSERQNHRFYLSITVILFVLSTVFVVAYTIDRFRQSVVFLKALKAQDVQLLIDYIVSDVEKTVVYSFELLVTVFLNDSRSDYHWALRVTGGSVSFTYSVGSAAINLLITLLTAGRVWWVNRQLQAECVLASNTFICKISRIILESGLLYPLFTIVGLVLTQVPSQPDAIPFDAYPLVTLTALSQGIAPTLIIVRARIEKRAVTKTMISQIRFNSEVQAEAREEKDVC